MKFAGKSSLGCVVVALWRQGTTACWFLPSGAHARVISQKSWLASRIFEAGLRGRLLVLRSCFGHRMLLQTPLLFFLYGLRPAPAMPGQEMGRERYREQEFSFLGIFSGSFHV